MPRIKYFAVAALALFLLSGCDLVGGQLRIVQDVIPPNPSHQATDQSIGVIGVDLSTNKDFQDNKDKIKSVDEVGFVFRVQNNLSTPATGRIYMTATPLVLPSLGTLQQQATLVLDGLALPGNGTLDVPYDQSIALQKNRDLLHAQLKTGTIYLYGAAEGAPFNVTIDQLTVVLVLNVTL
jgi:hypothetical protein